MKSTVIVLMLALCSFARADVVEKLVGAAEGLSAALSEEQRDRAFLPWTHDERGMWSYFPGEHVGLDLRSCAPEAQANMLAVVRAGLSAAGFAKAEVVRQLDEVLKADGGNNYDAGAYYLAIWGEPSLEGRWGLRWQGHHLSLNWVIKDGKIMASTPQFIGSNPATVASGPLEGVRNQAAEEDQARALVEGMNETQRAAAVAGEEPPREVLTGSKPQVREDRIEEAGIPYGELSEAQQEQFRALLSLFIDIQCEEVREARGAALEPGALADTRFAWFGGLGPDDPHYYRIMGPGYLVEYANTQGGANHVHTVWRDYGNDFGRDILGDHLALHHGAGAAWLFPGETPGASARVRLPGAARNRCPCVSGRTC